MAITLMMATKLVLLGVVGLHVAARRLIKRVLELL